MMQHWNYFAPILLLMVLNVRFSFGFKAAVFEHAEQSDNIMSTDPKKIIDTNLKYYTVAVEKARSEGVDIMVFPEYGIFPSGNRITMRDFLEYIPDPRVARSNPCENPRIYSDRPILYNLSCLARKNEMILVANMGDIQPCNGQKECPRDGFFHFNTDVAVGRDGTILAKYHKEHLFVEPGMDIPIDVQDPTFQTHLGRFAMFVCFDLAFKRVTEVARWKDVKAVLLPTKWVNYSPMLNALQSFESWAIGNNVTLLAANVHRPGGSAMGSGIMRGRKGAQVYTFNPDGQSKLLITELEVSQPNSSIYIVTPDAVRKWQDDGMDVEKECSRKVLSPAGNMLKEYRCQEVDTQNYALRKLDKTRDRLELCNGRMCCRLDYTANRMDEDYYLGVFNGTFNLMDRYFFAEENCLLARCDGLKGKSCVTFPMRSDTRFYDVYLRANFSTPFIYPSVMSSGMRQTPKHLWSFQTDGKIASIHFKSLAGKDLLTVGFKARAYDRDPPYER